MQTTTSKLTTPRYMEHRWGERIDLDCSARLDSYDGTVGAGRLRNASISGAFIATAVRLAPLTPLNIVLTAGKGASRRRIELPACVTRSSREGIAVEWRDMAVPTLVALLREAGASEGVLRTRDRVFG
jgi:hypothetical protein